MTAYVVLGTKDIGEGVLFSAEIEQDYAQDDAAKILAANWDKAKLWRGKAKSLQASYGKTHATTELYQVWDGEIAGIFSAAERLYKEATPDITEEQFYKAGLAAVNTVLERLGKAPVTKLEPSSEPVRSTNNRACTCPISTTLAKRVPGTRFSTSGYNIDMYPEGSPQNSPAIAKFGALGQNKFTVWADTSPDSDAKLAAIEA